MADETQGEGRPARDPEVDAATSIAATARDALRAQATAVGVGAQLERLRQDLDESEAAWGELIRIAPREAFRTLNGILAHADAAVKTRARLATSPSAHLLGSPTVQLLMRLEASTSELAMLGREREVVGGHLAHAALLRGLIEGHRMAPPLRALLDSVDRTTAAYQAAVDTPGFFEHAPAWLTLSPPRYAATATRVVAAVLAVPFADVPGDDEIVDGGRDAGGDGARREVGRLNRRLAALGPEFAEAYEGALSAARRREPDWVRHVEVSLRELMIRVLERLAPNDAMEREYPEPTSDEWRDGDWTRKARLQLILELMLTGGMPKLATSVIEPLSAALMSNTLSAVTTASHGVHELLTPHSPDAVRVYVAFTEGQLDGLLTAVGR